MSFRGSAASRGIFPSGKLYFVLVILATWEDPSTPFHFGRDDRSGWFRFVPTGYIRDAPGTAHRPFPTVLLEGGTVQPHGLYSKRSGRQIAAPTVSLVGGSSQPHRLYLRRFMAMNHRRYIAWYHSTAQVIFGTWRAEDCRPY